MLTRRVEKGELLLLTSGRWDEYKVVSLVEVLDDFDMLTQYSNCLQHVDGEEVDIHRALDSVFVQWLEQRKLIRRRTYREVYLSHQHAYTVGLLEGDEDES